MLEQELKNIWNNSSQTAQISIETTRLSEELNAKVRDIQKAIRVRDIREISASVIGIFIFSYLLYEIPFPITRMSCILSIIWFVFVIYKSKKSKAQNTKNDLSLSMTDQLSSQERAMKQQASFLNSAAYWYAAPSFIINFIFVLGLGNPSDYNWTNSIAENLLPLTFNFKIVLLAGLALFYTFTVWLNKRAVNKDVKPILESIKTMQQQLKNA
jgi:hypothetical protein